MIIAPVSEIKQVFAHTCNISQLALLNFSLQPSPGTGFSAFLTANTQTAQSAFGKYNITWLKNAVYNLDKIKLLSDADIQSIGMNANGRGMTHWHFVPCS